jgi:hypothetical protein
MTNGIEDPRQAKEISWQSAVPHKNLLIAGFVIAFVFSYDFYYAGPGRIFDFAAFTILLLWHLHVLGLPSLKSLYAPSLLCLAISGFYFIRGGEIRHTAGLIFIVLFWYFFREFYKTNRSACWLALEFVSLLIATIFIIQLLLFTFSGYVLDLNSLAGSIPARIYIEETNYFRSSSIYQEPNSYCVFAFIVASLIIMCKRAEPLARITLWLMLATLIISNSLWGIVVCLVLVAIALATQQIKVKSIFAISLLGSLLISSPIWYQERTTYRLLHLASESTLVERYLGSKFAPSASRNSGELGIFKDDVHPSSKWETVLGHGLSSIGFQRAHGANGWSYVFYNLGIIGLIAFVVISIAYDKSRKGVAPLSLFLLLTSFPYFTYAIFALFIVMLYEREDSSSVKTA